MEIKNKIIVITGASGGIGLSTARLLAREGAKVVLAARSLPTLLTLEKEIPNSYAVKADMRNPDEIKRLIEKTIERFGRVDVLVNNAGQGMYGPVETIDVTAYRDIIDLNVYGVLLAMQAIIPIMRKQGGGMIVNISSRVSKNHFPNLGAYASTKYALNGLTLTARDELAPDHIIVSLVHPKMTATDFGKNSIRTGEVQHPRPGDRPGMEVDPPERVAEVIRDTIVSEEAEAEL